MARSLADQLGFTLIMSQLQPQFQQLRIFSWIVLQVHDEYTSTDCVVLPGQRSPELVTPSLETMPRESIHALLGILTDAVPTIIVPDYTLSCEDTDTMAARALRERSYDNVLSFDGNPKVYNNFPPWATDWFADHGRLLNSYMCNGIMDEDFVRQDLLSLSWWISSFTRCRHALSSPIR